MARAVRLAAVLAAVGVVGCGRTDTPAPASVRGTVSFEGRPLAGGLIVFAPDREKGNAAQTVTATIATDGGYRLLPDGATTIAPGWYRVAIADAASPFAAGTGPRFPTALRRPDRSGIVREVKPGQDHVLNFDIDTTE